MKHVPSFHRHLPSTHHLVADRLPLPHLARGSAEYQVAPTRRDLRITGGETGFPIRNPSLRTPVGAQSVPTDARRGAIRNRSVVSVGPRSTVYPGTRAWKRTGELDRLRSGSKRSGRRA